MPKTKPTTNKRTFSLPSLNSIGQFLWAQKFHVLALLVVGAWCFPYLTSPARVELGDFSFFSQMYEAVRISILEYHQFPWWNPWMGGGFPLYANPQTGVFSIQTLFVLPFGAVLGLKIAVVIYTIAGYFSMFLLLRRYFKVRAALAIPLSLAWILSTFFVAHLPAHFTFVWYLLIPLFVYLSLTARGWKGGLLLGGAFAIMALSAVHNPFFQIALVCGMIILTRLIAAAIRKSVTDLKSLGSMIAAAAGTLLVIAGHRMFLCYQTVTTLNRAAPQDPPIRIRDMPYAVFMPFDREQYLYGSGGGYPGGPFSWGEVTSSAGIILTILFFIALGTLGYFWITRKLRTNYKKALIPITVLVGLCAFFMVLGIGNFHELSPYAFLKHLPVFGDMRVSTRWFLWATLLMLVVVAVVAERLVKNSRLRLVSVGAVCLVVIELFATNVGYQYDVFSHTTITAPNKTSSYNFTQIDQFGSMHEFADGRTIPNDNTGPRFYREYEATTYNIGVVRANETLFNNRYQALRCVEDSGCGMILSGNATIESWTPTTIVLKRTAPGKIVLNVNPSRYITVNGQRLGIRTVADTKRNVEIATPDSEPTITVSYSPVFKQ